MTAMTTRDTPTLAGRNPQLSLAIAPRMITRSSSFSVSGGEEGSTVAGPVGTTPPRLDSGEPWDHEYSALTGK